MRFILAAFCFISCFSVLAQNPLQQVTVKGVAPDYAGYNLVMRKVVNPISLSTADIMVLRVDEKGHFEQSIEISEITHASLDMGQYRGDIFLEPGMTYELVLPPFKPRTDAERFNPYFMPEDVILGIKNDEALALNEMMARFDQDLSDLYNQNARAIFTRSDISKAKKIENKLDSLYSSNNPYFKLYKNYAYGELRSLAYKRNKRTAEYLTFGEEVINTTMPSFIKSFNTIYKGFFSSYFSSAHGDSLRSTFSSTGSFDTLTTSLQSDTLYAKRIFAELVLLKGMYDAFYTGRYDEEHIIGLVKDAKEKSANLSIKDIAHGIYKQLTWLRVGTAAPQFTLYRLDGREKSLSDYEGKFVYLNFMHTNNHTCKQDLQLLNVLSKQLRRELTIVTVIMDEDPTKALELVKKNKYRWDFLHYAAMPKVALDYNIRALPAYFVVDPSQQLRISPAPSPSESFTPIFIEAQRKYHYEQMRKNRPKEKSIYDF